MVNATEKQRRVHRRDEVSRLLDEMRARLNRQQGDSGDSDARLIAELESRRIMPHIDWNEPDSEITFEDVTVRLVELTNMPKPPGALARSTTREFEIEFGGRLAKKEDKEEKEGEEKEPELSIEERFVLFQASSNFTLRCDASDTK